MDKCWATSERCRKKKPRAQSQSTESNDFPSCLPVHCPAVSLSTVPAVRLPTCPPVHLSSFFSSPRKPAPKRPADRPAIQIAGQETKAGDQATTSDLQITAPLNSSLFFLSIVTRY